MLYGDPLPGMLPVAAFLLFGQFVFFSFFAWQLCIAVQLVRALVAAIHFLPDARVYPQTTLLIQSKVVAGTVLKMNTDDLPGIRINYHLNLMGMALLLTAILALLTR